jgi:hypothetical protein
MAKFTIYLWKAEPASRHSNDNDDDDTVESIIVEIQRHTGCCILMHQIQRSLFHYIMTGQVSDATASTGSNTSSSFMTVTRTCAFDNESMFHRVICSSIRRQQKEQQQASEEELCKDNIEICVDLLNSDWEDHKRMCMESLVLMTNPLASCEKLARAIARALIYGNDDHGMISLPSSCFNALRDQLMKHLEHNDQPTAIQAEVRESIVDNDDTEALEYEQGHDFGVLHNLALHVLVNTLQVVSSQNQDNTNSGTMNVDLTSDFWYTATKAFVYNLSVAVHRPDEASLSARCLALLQAIAPLSSHDFLTMLEMHDQFFLKKLFQAQDYGRAHHLRLEQASRLLLGRLATAKS